MINIQGQYYFNLDMIFRYSKISVGPHFKFRIKLIGHLDLVLSLSLSIASEVHCKSHNNTSKKKYFSAILTIFCIW